MKQVIDGRDAGAFISSALDDFGLDPHSFRIYARIARQSSGKNGCCESIYSMANACKMTLCEVDEALSTLLHLGLIEGDDSSVWLVPIPEQINGGKQ